MITQTGNGVLDIGADIGGYRITGILGQGGFGITYAAENVFGEKVAIKQFLFLSALATSVAPEEIIESQKIRDWALAAFRKTVFELKRLQHPNIVKVLHFIPAETTGFLVMELVEGVSLDRMLRERGRLSVAEVEAYLTPVLDALDYVHGKDRIHRDVAPDNIMIRPDGSPMLIDFGSIKQIARDVDHAEEEAGLTRVSQGLSYPIIKRYYSPPEQYQYGAALTPAADIYSVGAVMYRALTGRPPVDAQARLHHRTMDGEDGYVTAGADAPGAALDRALRLRVAERTATIGELRAELGWDRARHPVPSPDESTDDGFLVWDDPAPESTTPAPLNVRKAEVSPRNQPTVVLPEPPPEAEPLRNALQGAFVSPQVTAVAPQRRWVGRMLGALTLVILGAGAMIAGPVHEQDQALFSAVDGDYARMKGYLASCRLCLSRSTVREWIAAAEADDLQRFSAVGTDPVGARRYADTCRVCLRKNEAEQLYTAALARDKAAYEAIPPFDVDAAQTYLKRCSVCADRPAAQKIIDTDAAARQLYANRYPPGRYVAAVVWRASPSARCAAVSRFPVRINQIDLKIEVDGRTFSGSSYVNGTIELYVQLPGAGDVVVKGPGVEAVATSPVCGTGTFRLLPPSA